MAIRVFQKTSVLLPVKCQIYGCSIPQRIIDGSVSLLSSVSFWLWKSTKLRGS